MSEDAEKEPHPLEAVFLDKDDPIPNIIPLQTSIVKDEDDIINEQPWHRNFAYKLLDGVSLVDCAKQFDKHPSYLGKLKAQKWFQLLVAQLARDSYQSDISGLLESEAATAIMVLADKALNAKSEAVQVRSASELLGKYMQSKPPTKPSPIDDPEKELEQINKKLLKYEKEEDERHTK